jgi:hypothetical protein
MASDRITLFYLREYDEAFRDVFSRVIRLRGEEAYPYGVGQSQVE